MSLIFFFGLLLICDYVIVYYSFIVCYCIVLYCVVMSFYCIVMAFCFSIDIFLNLIRLINEGMVRVGKE